MPTNERLLKISELAAAAGVSKQTIHFYLREGLLSPPVKSSRNMAYYDVNHIEEIRLIKEMQEQSYLPLAVIKLILDAKRSGKDFAAPDHLEMMKKVFTGSKDDPGERSLTITELADITDLTEESLKQLASMGLLTSGSGTDGQCFDGYDEAMAQALGRILNLGLTIDDLRIYSKLLDLYRVKAQIVHDKIIHHSDNHTHAALKDIYAALMHVNSLLTARVTRELIIDHLNEAEGKKRRRRD